jgi:hypothetical protein
MLARRVQRRGEPESVRSVRALADLRLRAHPALKPTHRAGSGMAFVIRDEEGGAAVGAAEEAVCRRAAQTPLGMAAATDVTRSVR